MALWRPQKQSYFMRKLKERQIQLIEHNSFFISELAEGEMINGEWFWKRRERLTDKEK